MFGSIVESIGTNANIIIPKIITNRKGNTFLVICPIEISAIPQAAKRAIPTGGVAIPVARAMTVTTPKWTILIPNVSAIGAKIGTTNRMIEAVSINVPSTK